MKLPRHAEIWLLPYIADRCRVLTSSSRAPIRRVWVVVADHYEPFRDRADMLTAQRRVDLWRDKWPKIAAGIHDSIGAPPKHTFFYAQEEYLQEFVAGLAEMTRAGIADVEVHIHHDREGRADFVSRIRTFCRVLFEQHGLLRRIDGQLRFGFIHGNWALDNSLPGGILCGLNDEITLLRDLGCYADFTMPSGNSPSQARTINKIYWCIDDPQKPKSYDRGVPLQPGKLFDGDLLIIPGPLGIRWSERILPRMETGEIAANDPPSCYRVRRWLQLAPRIGEDVFVKLYTHGAWEANAAVLLGGALRTLYTLILEEAERCGASAYFVSAWQMYSVIRAIAQANDPVGIISGAPCYGPNSQG